MPRLTLTRLILLIAATSVALLVLLGAALARDLRQLHAVVDDDLPRLAQVDHVANEMEVNNLEFGIATLRVLLRGQPEDRDRAGREEAELRAAMGRLDSLTDGSEQWSDLTALATPTEAFRRTGRALLDGAAVTGAPALDATTRARLDSLIGLRESLDHILDTDVQVRASAAVAEARRTAASLSNGLTQLMLAGGILALAAPLLLVAGVRRTVLQPAQRLTTTVGAVAGGDFTVRTDPSRAGDLTALAAGVNSMTEQLQTLTAQTERLAEVGLLAAGVAHEVRNPLFAISANLDAWQVGRHDERASGELVEQVRHEVGRLTDLMRDLLNYARPAPTDPAVQSVDPPIRSALAELQSLADREQVTIRTNIPDPAPVARIDRDRFRQAVDNVVRNAIAFTPAGGAVDLSVRATATGVSIVITDGGPGFPADDFDRVFRPFYTRRAGGTGLGLAIVSRIMQDFGGSATASNGPRGGMVTLDLPPSGA